MRHVYAVLEEIATRRLPLDSNGSATTEVAAPRKSDPNDRLAEEEALAGGFSAIQYTSSACRAARSEDGRRLPTSKLLAVINDFDVYKIHKNPGGQISYSFILLLMLPVVWAFQGLALDLLIEVVVPISWTGFMIANMYALQKMFWLFIGVYVFIGVFAIYYFREYLNSCFKFLRGCCTKEDEYSLSDKNEVTAVKQELSLVEDSETGECSE